MTITEILIHSGLFMFAVIGLPLLFVVINDRMGDWPESKVFDKSDLEYRDGDNT